MLPRSRLSSRQSKKFHERRKYRVLFIVALGVISVASWIFALSQFTSLGSLEIRDIVIENADEDIMPALRDAGFGALRGEYFGLLSKSNSFIYPEDAVAAAIRGASARIESLKIEKSGINKLIVTVMEKVPYAIVCTNLPDLINNTLSLEVRDDCYYADEEGFIFEKVPPETVSVYNHYFIPGLAGDDAIGSLSATTSEFLSLQSLYNEIRRNDIRVQAILVNEGGEYEIYAYNQSSETDVVVIYMNGTRSFEDQLMNLLSFWKRVNGPFEYIDVRYGSNVFYRLMQ